MAVKVYIASDHAGFALKDALIAQLGADGYEVEDLGAHEYDPNDDYPDFITPCSRKVAEENLYTGTTHAQAFGIVIGASGQGEAMCANRVPGVRAAVFYGEAAQAQVDARGTELDMTGSVRAHNDANILSLGARFLSEEAAAAAVAKFLDTPFSGGERHVRRLAKY